MKKLCEWLEKKCIKQKGFAKEIGISTSSLHQILRLGQVPSLRVAYEIEKFTQGDITLYDWIDQRVEAGKEKKNKDG